jgi:HlyD family secretion protein
VLVLPGEAVKSGQVLARLIVPALRQELQSSEALLVALEDDVRKMRERQTTNRLVRQEMFAHQERTLRQQLVTLQRLIITRESLLRDLESMIDRDLGTAVEVTSQREQVDAARTAASQVQAALAAVAVDRGKADADNDSRLDQLTEQLADQAGKVAALRERLHDASEIDSPIDGIVGEANIRPRSIVSEGQVLLTVRTRAATFEALSFLPAIQGNLVAPGMTAQLALNGEREEEFGTIRGTVQKVSDHPVSRRTVTELLQNDELVEAFFEDGPPIDARIALQSDSTTISGFSWSAGRGPPFAVGPGMLGTISVTVREQAPIALILPAIRTAVGGSG